MNIGIGATVTLIILGGVVFVGTLLVIMVRASNVSWVAETQVSLLARPRLHLCMAIAHGLCALGTVVLGFGFLSVGAVAGWAAVFAGGGMLMLLGFIVWIARRPPSNERDDRA